MSLWKSFPRVVASFLHFPRTGSAPFHDDISLQELLSVVLSLLKGPWAIFRGNFTLRLLSFGYGCSKIVLYCSFSFLSKILKWVWDPLSLGDVPL